MSCSYSTSSEVILHKLTKKVGERTGERKRGVRAGGVREGEKNCVRENAYVYF